MGPIVVVTELEAGRVADASQELLAKSREVADALGTTVTAVGFGGQAASALAGAAADAAIAVTGSAAEVYSPRVYERALASLLKEQAPSLVMLSNTTLGMDLGAALASFSGQPMVGYCTGLSVQDGQVVALSQIYGGKLLAEVEVPVTGSIITAIPGSWPAASAGGSPAVAAAVAEQAPEVELLQVIMPESGGDVDITRSDILVSVGRGIQGPENLELADELAASLGAVVSCSRPVVDAGWLPRSRQVGKSGQTVKPRAYLAMGISGAPEHLQGMKDAELIIAVNSDESAPIFEVAHFGAAVDILELMPVLAEKLQGRAG